MPATIQYPMSPPAKRKPPPVRREYTLEELTRRIKASRDRTARPQPAPAPVRRELPLEDLLRRLAAGGERVAVKTMANRFRPVLRGRPLTRREKALMLLMTAGLGLAIWLQARPAPVSAHTAYYQSIALSARLDATAPQTFTESALRAVGADWRAASLFACVHPSFWRNGPAIHPDGRAARVERGLTRLAAHGPAVSVLTFSAPTAVETQTIGGVDRMTSRVAGQMELADGTVVRFAASLVQDESTKRWGLVDLMIPGFLP
ncbi:MAG: hypothetical protein HYX71_11620 [Opitutae bacterium]|nr:hypothetical protein [Opitutae bacterium]